MIETYYSGLYQKDIATLKRYGNGKYKLTLHAWLRQKGFESGKPVPKCTVNDKKLQVNIARARSKIFEYAYCNPWEQFVNLTLSKEKYDRHDLRTYITDLSQWLRNYSRRHGIDIKYLFIPEHHKDGAWHIHGLLMGLPEEHLAEFIPGVHPQHLIDDGYLNWEPYMNKFGWNSFGKVQNQEAVSKYLTKYISKDMAKNNRELNARLYYCSKGLETAETIEKGTMLRDIVPDYENEHVKVKWLATLHEGLAYFTNQIIAEEL